MKYVFDDFEKVVSDCFGNDLDKDYGFCIEASRNSFMDLGVNITAEVHAAFPC